jgi:hypothetical protein
MLEIGDHVVYEGRAYVLVGVTPMSVTPFEMQLKDEPTGRTFWVTGQLRQQPDGLYEVLKDAAARAKREAREPEDP